jgi:hypothetical protein
MQGGQKQDNCLTINFVGSAAEKEKIECKLLELGMVAHATGSTAPLLTHRYAKIF